ncbi:MAG TPA: NAD-dependent epimerase/dehydratase family protein [Actinomycetota bacterium]|nr:NAD-dependent epimerase/dehydratase family protein [Actinomycetota bacterium]
MVVGASGNVGTSLLRALASDPSIESVLGLARRMPRWKPDKVTWAQADVASTDLVPHFRGAGAVVHLGWLIQPSRDPAALWATNVVGSARVFEAAAAAGVPAVVYASSIGAYAPGPKDRAVDESWPTTGIASSPYSVQKAYVERLLDVFERDNPGIRVVRLRPGLIFKSEAGSGVRRLFAGPLLPRRLVGSRMPVVPDLPALRFQALHATDVAEAYRLAITRDVRGAFNVAADPVLDPRSLSEALGGRRVRVPAPVLRAAVAASWWLRLHPTDPGWVDLALQCPLMDTTRARRDLGWIPAVSATDALRDLLEGIGRGDSVDTPPLSARSGGPLRLREFLSGVGKRDGGTS